MKAFIALLAGVALVPNTAIARQPVLVAAPGPASITTCAISGDASSLTASFTLTSGSTIGGISGGVIAGITITPSNNGEGPNVTVMAIKTRGAGSQDRTARANNAKDCGSQDRGAAATGSNAAPQVACATSDDGMSVSVSGLSVPVSSKVSVQDLSFVSSSKARSLAAGPGGGPHVLARCSGADGVPNNVTMLLLPAVQK